MNKTQIQKIVILYGVVAIYMCSLFLWHDPLISLLSMGFLLGFLWNETFFAGKEKYYR